MYLDTSFDLKIEKMDAKTTFIHEDLKKKFILSNIKVSLRKGKISWFASLRNPFMI